MSDDKTIGEELSQEEFLARVRHARLSDAELASRYGVAGRRPTPFRSPRFRSGWSPWSIRCFPGGAACSPPPRPWPDSRRPGWEALCQEVEGVCRTSLDLAYHLCVHAPEVLRHLPDDAIHPWVLELLEVYDQKGTQGCIRVMRPCLR